MNNNIQLLSLKNIQNKKIACLTMDIESDYGELLDVRHYEGLKYLPKLVDYFASKMLPLTCFVQGSLLETHGEYLNPLASIDTEFHLHSYSHPRPDKRDFAYEIKAGKEAYIKYFGCQPEGYRAPLGVIEFNDLNLLIKEDFKFDSSIFPAFRPGSFNNSSSPILPYRIGTNQGIIEFPFSVFSRYLRMPLSLSFLKLLGRPYRYLISHFSLPDFIVFNFHLHDIYQLQASKLLNANNYNILYKSIYNKIYIQNKVDGYLLLNNFILLLQQRGYSFFKMTDVYKMVNI